MKKITFGDCFNQEFKDQYKIDEEIVRNVINDPNDIQKLENQITLCYKDFPDGKLSSLLVCTALVESQNLFAFAIWLPQKITKEKTSLKEMLISFANEYGLMIQIGNTSSKFIEKISVSLNQPLGNLNQIMNILGPENIPYKALMFTNQKPIDSLIHLDCYYCFAINEYKYFGWLLGVETIEIKVRKDWQNIINDFKDVLDPVGSTGIGIFKPKPNLDESVNSIDTNSLVSKEEVDLSIPKIYKNQFGRINEIINSLKIGEKFILVPYYSNNKCIFCDSVKTSKEHIFPKWFRKIFEEKTFDYSITVQTGGETLLEALNSPIGTPKHSSYGLTSQNVCEQCNTGWMSKLEQDVMKILLDDEGNLKTRLNEIDLGQENKDMLSKWITTKAMLLLIKSNWLSNNLGNWMYEMKIGTIPNGFVVEIIEFENFDLNFTTKKGIHDRRIELPKTLSLDSAMDIAREALIACIQIGNFVFRISYIDESKGLKRFGFVKPTITLFPAHYQIPYRYINGEVEKWGEIENNLKLATFSFGLGLFEE